MTATPKFRVSRSVGRLHEADTSAFVVRELEPREHHYLSLLSDDAVEALLGGTRASAEYDCLGENTWCAGAFSDEILLGVVRCQLIDVAGVVETSVFVIEPWRRGGIGAALLQAAQLSARQRGCKALRIHCHRSNWSMRAFLERVGARLDLVVGQIVADISIKTLAENATVS